MTLVISFNEFYYCKGALEQIYPTETHQ